MKNKTRIKQKIQQFLTLGIVVLLICPLNLAAERKGAQLMIVKEDGQVIDGELLRVKENSLLLMTSGSETGVTVDFNEMIKLKIKRKAKFGKGALIGLLIGGGLGLLYAGSGDKEGENVIFGGSSNVGGTVVFMGAVGAGVGGIIGSMKRGYKEIQVKGKAPSQIKEIMSKLNKKARFKT